MIYSILADALLILHLLFIIFVVIGALLVLKWRWLVFLHIPAVSWGILVEFNHWICPLTPMENRLRHAAGNTGYESEFIEHYLIPVIYPAGLDNASQILLGSFVMLINILIYTAIALHIRKTS